MGKNNVTLRDILDDFAQELSDLHKHKTSLQRAKVINASYSTMIRGKKLVLQSFYLTDKMRQNPFKKL